MIYLTQRLDHAHPTTASVTLPIDVRVKSRARVSLNDGREAGLILPRGLLLDTLWDGWLDTARQLGCVAIVCNHALWDAGTVAQVKAAGMRALSYTVNDEWAAQRLIELDTDGVVTDRVDLFSPAASP